MLTQLWSTRKIQYYLMCGEKEIEEEILWKTKQETLFSSLLFFTELKRNIIFKCKLFMWDILWKYWW